MITSKSITELLKDVKVEWKSLGEVTNYEQPTKYIVKSTDYDNEYETPVLTAGKTFILGYTNEFEGIYTGKKNPVIIFDDFTTANKWVDFDFKVKSSAMKIISSADDKRYQLKYIYYWINTFPTEKIDNDHKRQWINNFANKQIPIPSFPIQNKITAILDTFTTMTAELTAELNIRKQQYDYYRNKLLTFKDSEVEWKTLDNISQNLDFLRKPITSNFRNSGKFPYYGASGIVDYVDNYIFDGNYLLISEDGANLIARKTPIAFSVNGKIWVNNHAHILLFDNYIEQRYVELYLNNIDLTPYISGATQPKLNQKNLNDIKIPIPPLSEQKRIVEILDKFDSLTNSITEGLPREIELRQKQYEYYRDLLLDFPRVNE